MRPDQRQRLRAAQVAAGPAVAGPPPGERDDCDRVLSRVGGEQVAPVRGDAEVGREGAGPLRAADRDRLHHTQLVGVDHRDQVLVRHRDVGPVALRVHRDRLRVGEAGADLDRLHVRPRGEVDDVDRALGLAGQEAELAVTSDPGAVGIVADGDVADAARAGVDDRRRVGQVERGQQGPAVAAHRQVAGPGELLRARRELLDRHRAGRRRHRDHPGPPRVPALAVQLEDVDHVPVLAGNRVGHLLVLVLGVAQPGDVGGAAVARHRDAA